MKFKTRIEGDVGIIVPSGKLMGYPETDQLHDEVRSMIGEGITKVVLDLHKVSWMNSMGVGAMMRCLTTLKNKEGELFLTGITEKVRSIFLITECMFPDLKRVPMVSNGCVLKKTAPSPSLSRPCRILHLKSTTLIKK